MPIVLRNVYSKLVAAGIGHGAVRNCGHVGRLGEWVEHPAEAGYAALLFVNDNGLNKIVAPRRQVRRHEQNPIAFSIPLLNGQIFSADMSTAAMGLEGRKSQARWEGGSARLHPGRRRRADAQPGGAVRVPGRNNSSYGRPLGYKGFALSISVDLLVAGLSGGQASSAAPGTKGEMCDDRHMESGTLFRTRSHETQAAKYCAGKSVPPVDMAKPVRLPAKNQSCEIRRRPGYRVELGIDRRSGSTCDAIWRVNCDV